MHESDHTKVVVYRLPSKHGILRIEVVAQRGDETHSEALVLVRRSEIVDTPDLPLWSVIRASTERVS